MHYSCPCDGPELGPYASRTIGAVPTGPVSHDIRVYICSASEGSSPPHCSRVFRRHVPRRSSRSITFMSPPSPLFHYESSFQKSTAPNISLMANNCHRDGASDGQTRRGEDEKGKRGGQRFTESITRNCKEGGLPVILNTKALSELLTFSELI